MAGFHSVPLFSAGGFAPHNVPRRNKHNSFFLTCSIQFLSRHWLCVQLCLCSQCTVLSIHFLAQLQGRLQPHAPLLEPAQIWSCRQEPKCLDTGGSPCFPDRSTTECHQHPEEEQVVKTSIQSLTTIPKKQPFKRNIQKTLPTRRRVALLFMSKCVLRSARMVHSSRGCIQAGTQVLLRVASGRRRVKELTHFPASNRAESSPMMAQARPHRCWQGRGKARQAPG